MTKLFSVIGRKLFYLLNRNQFLYLDYSAFIFSPLRIDGKQNIKILKDVVVQYKTWLAAVPVENNDECILEIGKGSIIGNFNHIYATRSIKIGENVLTADKVYISDNTHDYADTRIPIMHQPVKFIGNVEIGDGSWLGENVCVIGAKIGKHCVVGANSVVTKDIPDYTVAVGVPARVIKRFNSEENCWEAIK